MVRLADGPADVLNCEQLSVLFAHNDAKDATAPETPPAETTPPAPAVDIIRSVAATDFLTPISPFLQKPRHIAADRFQRWHPADFARPRTPHNLIERQRIGVRAQFRAGFGDRAIGEL